MLIRTKLFASLAFLLAVLLVTLAASFLVLDRLDTVSGQSSASGDRVANLAVPLLSATKDVRFDVVQVQQWLTDISATQAKDGLGDGFDVAKEFADRFAADSARALQLAKEAGLDEIVAALEQLQRDFDPYFAVGNEMARAYVAEGPAGGNKLMAKFDAVAQTMGDDVEKLSSMTEVYIADAVAGSQQALAEGVAAIALFKRLAIAPLVIGLFTALAAFLVVRGITRPLGTMTDTMQRLSGGDLAVAIGGIERRDEIGAMARTVETFKEGIIESTRLKQERDAARARAAEERKTAMTTLVDSFNGSVGPALKEMADFSRMLNDTAASMFRAADETSNRSVSVAGAAEQATQSVQTVAAATEELSASVREIKHRVDESSRIVAEAVTQTSDTNARIEGLSHAVAKIGEVAHLIGDIAAQTNLLALNATIEAARAGEAGKGFAVVASEVKALANQTARATDEIDEQIRAIQMATSGSSQAILAISKTITQVNDIAGSIAVSVEQQGAATQEISRSVQQAAIGTAEVSSNITVVSQSARETGSVSRQLLETADALSAHRSTLQTQIDAFLRGLAV